MTFEVPYNFDEKLVSFYIRNSAHISYLYLPPYKDDLDNTRTSIQTKSMGHCYMPESRMEYEGHLREIHKVGLKFVVLWQVQGRELSIDIIDYYCSLGTSGFIVADDRNAEIIKHYRSDLIVICSIVQRTCADAVNRKFENYDHIILHYPFNRALDALRRLSHIKDKIILMPNTMCNVECPSLHHWFPSSDQPFDASRDCPMTIRNISKCGLIFPEHLSLFDNHVGGYKLQGREYPTSAIKYICSFDFNRRHDERFVEPFFAENMATNLKSLKTSMTPEEYYNTKTNSILSAMARMDLNTSAISTEASQKSL